MDRMNERRSTYKRYTIRAARELHYSEKVIKKIEETNNDTQISQIMKQARTNGGKLSSEY